MKNTGNTSLAQIRRLTQAELLAEAARTELDNVASLRQHPHLEIERARNRARARDKHLQPAAATPRIRFRSDTTTTTISFSHPHLLLLPANDRPRHLNVRHLCPISGLPARYLDPRTLTPYATVQAFRTVRLLHLQAGETGEKPLDLLRKHKAACRTNTAQTPTPATTTPTHCDTPDPPLLLSRHTHNTTSTSS
jgi:hypothetical protein